MTDADETVLPAFYAVPAHASRRAWSDWWVLLHPPYTLWHLSYVAIGGTIAPGFDGGRLAATILAFFLAVGVGAHALDELHGRPLGTAIPGWVLAAAAIASVGVAVAIGIIGITRVGPSLVGFIVVGVALNFGYNLELLGGRLHNDVTFAVAWGSFPVLTAYTAQAETLRPAGLVAAAGAYWLSRAQRSLSTPARTLRRRVASVDATVTLTDGRIVQISRPEMLAPLETALKMTAWSVVGLATSLVLFRTIEG